MRDLRSLWIVRFLGLLLLPFLMDARAVERAIPPESALAPQLHVNPTFAVDQKWLGGSNYFYYDLGEYGVRFNHPPEKPWANLGNMKLWDKAWYSTDEYAPNLGPQLVLQNLHQAEVIATVRAQFTEMRNQGQTAIVIPIWLSEAAEGNGESKFGHVFNWNGLTTQQQMNLLNLTDEIYNAGFLKITYRFNINGYADPSLWNGWSDTSYQKCKNFILNTIALVRPALLARFGSWQNRWSFDLGGELGGLTTGQVPRYTAQLMKDYVNEGFPISETVGFSMLCSDNNSGQYFLNQFRNLSSLGPAYVPQNWAVTCYSRSSLNSNVQNSLASLAGAMKQAGCPNQPVVIIECLNNDAGEAAEISRAISQNPTLNIVELYQWPISRAAMDNGVWTVDSAYADHFTNYLRPPQSSPPGIISFELASSEVNENVASGKVTLKVIRTGNTRGEVQIPWSTANGTAVSSFDYLPASGNLIFSDGQDSATFSITILDDKLPEKPKSFNVSLGSPSGSTATLGSIVTESVTIFSDEVVPPPSRVIGGSQITTTKGKLSGVKLNFSYDLASLSTKNMNAYRLKTPGNDGVFGTADDISVPITKAAYDNSKKTVTLSWYARKLQTDLRLTISGSGDTAIEDKFKQPIDGNLDGAPGGDALINVTKNGLIHF